MKITPSPHIAHVITGARRLRYAHGMARYFFDTRDNSHSLRDELGLELDSLEEARDEATRGLADLARMCSPAQSAESWPWRFETKSISRFCVRLFGPKWLLSP